MADKNRKPDQPKVHGRSDEIIDEQTRGEHAGGGQQHPTHPHPGSTPHRHEVEEDQE